MVRGGGGEANRIKHCISEMKSEMRLRKGALHHLHCTNPHVEFGGLDIRDTHSKEVTPHSPHQHNDAGFEATVRVRGAEVNQFVRAWKVYYCFTF